MTGDQNQLQLERRNAELEQQVRELQAQLAADSPATRYRLPDPSPPANSQEALSQDKPVSLAPDPEPAAADDFRAHKAFLQRALRSLQRSEARYQALVHHSPDAIARCLPDGIITLANAAFCRYLGRSQNTVVGSCLWDVLSSEPATLAQMQRGLRRLSAEQALVRFEQRSIRAGRVHWQQWLLMAVLDPHGKLMEVQILGRDISDHKQLEQPAPPAAEPALQSQVSHLDQVNRQLRQEIQRLQQTQATLQRSQQRYQWVFSALYEGVLLIDRSGNIQTCNSRAAILLGQPAPELMRHNILDDCWQWVHEDGLPLRPGDHPVMLTAQTGIACVDVVLGLVQPDRPNRWLQFNVQPLFRPGEDLPAEIVVSVTDVTQHKHIEWDCTQLALREKQAQLEAASAREQINHILETVTDGFVALDREWRLTYINREAARTIGRTGKSLLGKVLWQEFPEFAQTSIATLYRQVMQQGKAVASVEYYAPCQRWYSLRIYPSATGLSIYFRNMTDVFQTVYDRSRAEEDLRNSEERFRQLADNIPQVFWMYDVAEQRLSYISPACREVLGLEPDLALKTPWATWLHHIHPDDVSQVQLIRQQPLLGQATEVTCRFTKPDATTCWLLARAFPVRNAVGQVYRVAGTLEDITNRQQTENWLKLLESVIVNANDAVVITEAEPVELPGPRIVYVNDAFTRMMGYRREEVIGKTPRILQGPRTNLETLKFVRSALKRWESVLVEMVNYHQNGSEVWIELSLFPVADTMGNYTYWVGIQRDITNRKQAEAEMQKALAKERELSELKSRFVSTTSHEFRTPLSTILSSADLLEFYAQQGDLDRYQDHLHRIQISALNMNHLLNDILVIEKAEAHKLNLDPVDFNLRDFCTALVEEMQLNDQGHHQLVFQVQRADGVLDQQAPIPVHMDEKLLRQVFTNLLSNALKYSDPGTTIHFSLSCETDRVIVTVRDEGIGVPPQDQERLFEPFHRGTNVGTISGNGLGLAIVKQSLDLHQGTITIQSALNQGTTVTVTLPRRVEPPDDSA
jgi:PAS domain S-box-containing protein